ncbi:adaptor protein MecA [Mesobacillus maritimus]|uniref:adaptor protein MecA n=1 Tax=Mesobacillus maritimus TaxID=1643336 RepID=UPI00203BC248|nr:adaptor protein MecA [Mesobacillus maritimus]MCM3586151.1 adaptor protein MecA [Mesobacillus maritimus]MCM3667478.1 adaptor protein MecA [Mesobacillus maritimus]
MEIERINDNTVKFYISYIDIEERGFDREEIWYNRERSEELFWEMMDEVNHEAEFTIEGPLWIQVQALEKGLEILVTKTQVSKDGQKYELPITDERIKDLPVDDRIEEMLDHHFNPKSQNQDMGIVLGDELEYLLVFKDFEDIISLSNRHDLDSFNANTRLFSHEGRYYLYVDFSDYDYEDEDSIDNFLSILLEYGEETAVSIHRLEEYGNKVMDENVFSTVRKYFS